MFRTSGGFDDPDNYLPLARSLAAGLVIFGFAQHGRPTAYRPPLYPLMLMPLVANAVKGSFPAIACLHLALGAGTVWLTARAGPGFRDFLKTSLFAAFVVACDPVLVWQCRSVMTETPTAFLLVLGFAGLCRRGHRERCSEVLPSDWPPSAAPACCRGHCWRSRRAAILRPGSLRTRLTRAGLLGSFGFCHAVTLDDPQSRSIRRANLATTHGGYTLALANNPVYYREVVHGAAGARLDGARPMALVGLRQP